MGDKDNIIKPVDLYPIIKQEYAKDVDLDQTCLPCQTVSSARKSPSNYYSTSISKDSITYETNPDGKENSANADDRMLTINSNGETSLKKWERIGTDTYQNKRILADKNGNGIKDPGDEGTEADFQELKKILSGLKAIADKWQNEGRKCSWIQYSEWTKEINVRTTIRGAIEKLLPEIFKKKISNKLIEDLADHSKEGDAVFGRFDRFGTVPPTCNTDESYKKGFFICGAAEMTMKCEFDGAACHPRYVGFDSYVYNFDLSTLIIFNNNHSRKDIEVNHFYFKNGQVKIDKTNVDTDSDGVPDVGNVGNLTSDDLNNIMKSLTNYRNNPEAVPFPVVGDLDLALYNNAMNSLIEFLNNPESATPPTCGSVSDKDKK